MKIERSPGGFGVDSEDRRVGFGPARPRLRLGVDRTEVDWRPDRLVVDGDALSATHGATGVRIEVELPAPGDVGPARIRGRVLNAGNGPVDLHRFTLAATSVVRVGEDSRRWRIYRNGYQSWSGTWTIGVDESDRDLPTRWGRTGATDARHRAAHGPGHVRSDALSAIADPVSGDALALGFTTLADAFGFVEIDAPHGQVRSLSVWVDLDGVELRAGEATPWFEVCVAAATPAGSNAAGPATGATAGWTALRAVAQAAGTSMAALGRDAHHPGGWCSWYYYFTKVTEADIVANLDVLAADGRDGPLFGCEYVMVDDGHQAAIGDWLTTNDKFPGGMAALADRIRGEGFDAGIWWAPFIVSARSAVARRHPDWLVRGRAGRPVVALVNPGWGITTPMWALDTTHPEVLAHLRETARVIGADWGYRIQKIDFLYAAALEGVRRDAGATRAQALRRGLQAIRDGSGDDGFILGCGCPLGPAVGLVDAMRIGSDVTPSWTTLLGRTVGRDCHALSTLHALINTMSRSVLDGAWFLNDPDCLMVRDTDTKLTLEEVRLMATVFAMTDGMLVLSDRMDRLSPARRELVAKSRALAGGTAEVVDLFENELPGLIVSRHEGRVDVGVVNLGDEPRAGLVDLRRIGVGPDPRVQRESGEPGEPGASGKLVEFWTGRRVTMRGGIIDVGELAPHSARVVQLRR